MDGSWYRDVNRFAVHTAWLHSAVKVFAVDGVALFGLLVLAGWWLARRQETPVRAVAAAVWAAAGTLLAVALNQPIVSAVARPRPYFKMSGLEVLVTRSHDFSFPSDHAVTAGAAAAGLWIMAHYSGRSLRMIAIAATVLAVLVAFSRVYVGAHYPGDVAAGLAVGAAMSLVGWLLLRPVLCRVVERIATVRPLRPLVTSAGGSGA